MSFDGTFSQDDLSKTLKQVVVTLGDRKNTGFCIKCGTDLLEPINDYQCCSVCTKDIEIAQRALNSKVVDYHKKGKPMPKTSGRIVVQSSDILQQVRPIGVPVK